MNISIAFSQPFLLLVKILLDSAPTLKGLPNIVCPCSEDTVRHPGTVPPPQKHWAERLLPGTRF